MLQSTLILIILALSLGCGAWLVFLWAARTGEFEDVEEPKYRMLEEDDFPISESQSEAQRAKREGEDLKL